MSIQSRETDAGHTCEDCVATTKIICPVMTRHNGLHDLLNQIIDKLDDMDSRLSRIECNTRCLTITPCKNSVE